MIRVLEFDDINDVIKYFNVKNNEWLTGEEFNQYLESKGVRALKSLVGKKNYCDRNDIRYKRIGKNYYFSLNKEQ